MRTGMTVDEMNRKPNSIRMTLEFSFNKERDTLTISKEIHDNGEIEIIHNINMPIFYIKQCSTIQLCMGITEFLNSYNLIETQTIDSQTKFILKDSIKQLMYNVIINAVPVVNDYFVSNNVNYNDLYFTENISGINENNIESNYVVHFIRFNINNDIYQIIKNDVIEVDTIIDAIKNSDIVML